MAYVPCGCEAVSIRVDPAQFEHLALEAGDPSLPLKLKKGANRAEASGGANALDLTAGPYVPENLQTLNGGNGIVVIGSGGTIPWTAAIDLHDSVDNIAELTDGKLLVTAATALGIDAGASCDEVLANTGSGLTGGSKHYSVSKLAVLETPQADFTGAANSGFNGTVAPHQSQSVFLSVTNPSCDRPMAVKWTDVCEIPHTFIGPSTVVIYQMAESAGLVSAGGAGTANNPVAQCIKRVETGELLTGAKPPPLTYSASGVIPPGDTLEIRIQFSVDWNSGTGGVIGFAYPDLASLGVVNIAAASAITSRIDLVGSTL